MFEMKDIFLNYREKNILQDISLSVASGDFLTVIGENGCGKSTLLRCVAGLHQQVSGSIRFQQKCLKQWPIKALAKERSFVAQSNQVHFAFLTENLLKLARADQLETEQQSTLLICQLAEKLNISHLFGRDVRSLSGGERQRVFIAKALLQLLPNNHQKSSDYVYENKLLLLDEPTSALDFRFQKAMMDLVQEFCQQGLAVVCVSHDMNLVLPYATQVLMLAQGRCLAKGQAKDVITIENLSDCFGVTPKLIPQTGSVPYITH
ncbi:ABC transporter ATP-binding protein [Paraglaciecola arctica]|uniref:ABC transporter ATP-binding protein n=1 Tax=Paraglaciecola arctica TaxID=1128911 RepID=UPI001C079076|nr:ABC transporter ATP-binding protein [Paraglaciecola arctica]MBU3002521.1 ABC transporter ATP-binding protein [Paraglaciecola arctica]